jgi:ATP-dependent DNA helicase RecG
MANADSGDIAIGIEDNGDVTGIDGHDAHLNELLRAPFDFCVPSVDVDVERLECKDIDGQDNHVLLMHVHQSSKLHANQADEAFYRVGDKSKKLSFEQRLQLLYAKGASYYEDEPVYNATIDDIDLAKVNDYIKVIGYGKDAETYLRENKEFVVNQEGEDKVSGAAILLFGKNPQQFFPRSYVRFIRFNGTEQKVGTEMNVVKDVFFKGTILEVIRKAIEYVQTQIKEYTFLGPKGTFVTIPEYPEFCWQELIVNAVAHRDYSIYGTEIQIKLFDDHFTVESPGFLPGMVRTYNMRHIHFSRNPKIAAFLRDYKVVKEFGEGVDRMFREMEEAGQPDPKYIQDDFILKATLRAKEHVEDNIPHENDGKKATVKSDGKKATVKSDGKLTNITQQQVNKLLEAMEPGKKYKSGELCEVLGLKETRMKEILRLLVNLGKIHTDGTFRDRTYSLNDEN